MIPKKGDLQSIKNPTMLRILVLLFPRPLL